MYVLLDLLSLCMFTYCTWRYNDSLETFFFVLNVLSFINSYNLQLNTTKETARITHSNPMTNDDIPAVNSPLLLS